MSLKPENLNLFIQASVVLHNFITDTRSKQAARNVIRTFDQAALQDEETDASQKKGGTFKNIKKMGYNAGKEANNIRDNFTKYFCKEGRVPWQDDKAGLLKPMRL